MKSIRTILLVILAAAIFVSGQTNIGLIPANRAVKDSDLSFSDITTNNATTSAHGLAPKGPNDATKFLDGTIAWDTVKDSDLSTSDITTNNVTSTKHGFAPKSPADATQFLNGASTPAYALVKDSDLSTSDITTNDVTSTKHGLAPKAPADATQFLNGAATPAYAQVKDSDLSTSDITTNNATSTKHGFAPKSPADATKFLNGAATPAFALVKDSDLSVSDVTTNNATTSQHGFLKKLDNVATHFMDGTGNWTAPTGTGSGDGGRNPNDPTTSAYIKDDFQVNTAATSGSFGELRWLFTGSPTIAGVVSEANHPGIFRITRGSIGTAAVFSVGTANVTSGRFADTNDSYLIARLGATSNNTIRFGFWEVSQAATADPPNDGIYFERLSTDTNWFGVTRSGSTETRTTTSTAGTTNFVRFRIRRIDASTIGFTMDNGTEVTSTMNIPTGTWYYNIQVKSTSGSNSLDVDFFDHVITGLSR